MAKDERTRYSDEELKEFEELILDKLNKAQNELNILKQSLNRSGESGTGDFGGGLDALEKLKKSRGL